MDLQALRDSKARISVSKLLMQKIAIIMVFLTVLSLFLATRCTSLPDFGKPNVLRSRWGWCSEHYEGNICQELLSGYQSNYPVAPVSQQGTYNLLCFRCADFRQCQQCLKPSDSRGSSPCMGILFCAHEACVMIICIFSLWENTKVIPNYPQSLIWKIGFYALVHIFVK